MGITVRRRDDEGALDVKELNEEIKLTLNLMQTDIDDAAHGELQSHLYGLLEIKRNELQQRLVERSWLEPSKPLTEWELKAGGWWCADVSEECRLALVDNGTGVTGKRWDDNAPTQCVYKSDPKSNVLRAHVLVVLDNLKQIHRIGNDFYWSQK